MWILLLLIASNKQGLILQTLVTLVLVAQINSNIRERKSDMRKSKSAEAESIFAKAQAICAKAKAK